MVHVTPRVSGAMVHVAPRLCGAMMHVAPRVRGAIVYICFVHVLCRVYLVQKYNNNNNIPRFSE